MRYVIQRLNARHDDMAYRVYITDELFYAGRNKTHTKRYCESMGLVEPEEEKSGDEIAADVIKNAGLVVME